MAEELSHLSASGALAYVRVWDGDAVANQDPDTGGVIGSWVTDESVTIRVYDLAEIGFSAPAEALGVGILRNAGGDAPAFLEIVQLQPLALLIACTVDEAGGVATTDATFGIDNVTVMQPVGGLLLATPDEAVNALGLPAEDDAACLAWYNAADGLWYGIPKIATDECS